MATLAEVATWQTGETDGLIAMQRLPNGRTEAANRLSRLGVLEPDGVEWALAVANRKFHIHQYDEIDRQLSWLTLSRDLPAWGDSLAALFGAAESELETDAG